MKAQMLKSFAAKAAAAVILGAVSLLITSCFYMPGVSRGKARAGLVLPRSLVANPISLALIVGGPGMETIYTSYTTIPPSISIEVPAGLARTFTVLLNSPSATLQGVATVDLQPGETKDINLILKAAGTQIIVPDLLSNRLVQVSDMSGAGWTEVNGGASTLYPWDVDFDDQGRIYVADSTQGILRIDDITDTSFETIPLGAVVTDIESIAMDRKRGLLYYIGDVNTDEAREVRRIQLDTGADERVEVENISLDGEMSVNVSYATAIAVDSDGVIYLSTSQTSPASVLKIDPNPVSSPALLAKSSYTFYSPFDVLVNGDSIYVSDPGAPTPPPTPRIVSLSRQDLGFESSFTGLGSGFLGPERFVAILNKPITVIDEMAYTFQGNRLVSFNDMTGAGWLTYEPEGEGLDAFWFFISNNSP